MRASKKRVQLHDLIKMWKCEVRIGSMESQIGQNLFSPFLSNKKTKKCPSRGTHWLGPGFIISLNKKKTNFKHNSKGVINAKLRKPCKRDGSSIITRTTGGTRKTSLVVNI